MKKLIIATFELKDEAINLLKQLQNEDINVNDSSIINKSEDKTVLGTAKVNPDGKKLDSSQKEPESTTILPVIGNNSGSYATPYGIGFFSHSKNGAITITGPLFYNLSQEEDKDLSKYLEKKGIPTSDIEKFEQALLKNHTVFLIDTNEEEAGIIVTKFLSNGALDAKTYDQ